MACTQLAHFCYLFLSPCLKIFSVSLKIIFADLQTECRTCTRSSSPSRAPTSSASAATSWTTAAGSCSGATARSSCWRRGAQTSSTSTRWAVIGRAAVLTSDWFSGRRAAGVRGGGDAGEGGEPDGAAAAAADLHQPQHHLLIWSSEQRPDQQYISSSDAGVHMQTCDQLMINDQLFKCSIPLHWDE